MPQEIKDLGMQNEFKECMSSTEKVFKKIQKRFPEEAQYVVNFAYNYPYMMKMNMREAVHMIELRTVPQGHQDYRIVAQKMYQAINKKHPILGNIMKFVDMNKYELEDLNQKKEQRKREIKMSEKNFKTDDEWKEELNSDEYEVCRLKGTERAFTGMYWDCKDDGVYKCRGCGMELFSSDTKFDSGTGWPSFFKPEDDERIEYIEDKTFGMVRVEVNCKRCGSHLGHVFDDGPAPSKLRYCINSLSLKLDKSN